jgi:hypothetical protein
MISVKECLALLNKNGNNYSEQEAKAIRQLLYELANIEFNARKNEERSNLQPGINR